MITAVFKRPASELNALTEYKDGEPIVFVSTLIAIAHDPDCLNLDCVDKYFTTLVPQADTRFKTIGEQYLVTSYPEAARISEIPPLPETETEQV